MSDEQNIDAGSETSGETADTAQADSAGTSASDTAQADEGADVESAGGAADMQDESGSETVAADADESRTGFVEKVRPGEECVCPDGRKGTVHKFDEGL